MKSGQDYRAIIVDTIKIINTVNSSSHEVTGSIEIAHPYKYGKKLKRLNLDNESRPIVNVYNLKGSSTSDMMGGIDINDIAATGSITGGSNNGNRNSSLLDGLSKSKGFVIENKTQNITSIIECTNIGVSIVELSPDDIN